MRGHFQSEKRGGRRAHAHCPNERATFEADGAKLTDHISGGHVYNELLLDFDKCSCS